MATLPGGSYGVIHGHTGQDLNVPDGHWVAFGADGGENIYAGNGHDVIFGGKGNDLIIGGQGNDTLIGGGGNDTLVSGSGNDTFVFGSGGGRDVVMNFHDGDILQVQRNINDLHVHSAADLVSRIHSDADGNAVIDFGHGDNVTLVGVKAEDIHHDPSGFIKVH